MKVLVTASSLDWSGWLAGVVGAFISGGASAIAAGTAVTLADPSHDIMGIPLLKVIAITFVVSGVVSLMKFLQIHPVPNTIVPPTPPTPTP